MSFELPALPIARMAVRLCLLAPVQLSSFPEATIRGGLGYLLRERACLFPQKQCSDCVLQRSCLYASLFCPPSNKDDPLLRNVEQIPRPWTFFAKAEKGRVILELTAFGGAKTLFPSLLEALSELGTRGAGKHSIRFSIDGISEMREMLLSDIPQGTEPEDVCMEIVSPMILRSGGNMLHHFESEPFMGTLLRRIYFLSVHQGVSMPKDWDYRRMLESFVQIPIRQELCEKRRSRFSTRQKKRLDYSGFKGRVYLEKVPPDLLPILRAGEILGVGKNTLFGGGRYRLSMNSVITRFP